MARSPIDGSSAEDYQGLLFLQTMNVRIQERQQRADLFFDVVDAVEEFADALELQEKLGWGSSTGHGRHVGIVHIFTTSATRNTSWSGLPLLPCRSFVIPQKLVFQRSVEPAFDGPLPQAGT